MNITQKVSLKTDHAFLLELFTLYQNSPNFHWGGDAYQHNCKIANEKMKEIIAIQGNDFIAKMKAFDKENVCLMDLSLSIAETDTEGRNIDNIIFETDLYFYNFICSLRDEVSEEKSPFVDFKGSKRVIDVPVRAFDYIGFNHEFKHQPRNSYSYLDHT